MSKSEWSSVELECFDLPPECTKRAKCPWCGEKTLSITSVENGYVFHCFRDVCDKRGLIPHSGIGNWDKEEPSELSAKEIKAKERYREVEAWWYEAPFSYPGTKYEPATCWSARTVCDTERGLLITRLTNGFSLKAVTAWARIGWLHGKKSEMVLRGPNTGLLIGATRPGHLLIVEDILSAMNLYQITEYPVFCLFGTNMTDEMEDFKPPRGRWLWCLDNDTNFGNQKYKYYREKFPTKEHRFRILEQDPKYYESENAGLFEWQEN